MIYRVIILGPQGSGKGTQGKMLADKFNIPLISSGALWRREIAEDTAIGKLVKEQIKKGLLASDSLTADLIRQRLAKPDVQNGFILDGYPRNQAQYILSDTAIVPTHVIAITLSDHEALKRMTGRLVCTTCGANYHVVYKPPKRTHGEGQWYCDDDDSLLTIRDDDKPEAINKRLHVYHQETEPLLKLYKDKGVLHEVDGAQEIENVFADILKVFE